MEIDTGRCTVPRKLKAIILPVHREQAQIYILCSNFCDRFSVCENTGAR